MRHLVILPAARADLVDVADFIALDNPERAMSFLAEIEAKMGQVAARPESFPVRDDVYQGMRAARHGRYLIFFLTGAEEVQVVRVLHGARDLPRLFL